MSIMTLSTNQLAKSFTSGADEKSYRSRQEKGLASVFCSKSKENAFFLKTKHASAGHIFSPYFSSFRLNGKRMLEIL